MLRMTPERSGENSNPQRNAVLYTKFSNMLDIISGP